MPLKTDYKNFIPSTTTKIHDIKQASDGTVINADVILEDVTIYSQEGDAFGSADINATNAQVNANTDAIALKAPLSSPEFTDIPKAPTAPTGTDTTQIASTEFVQQEIDVHKAENALDAHKQNPSVRVYHSVNQSIADSINVPLAFNSERFDTDNIHDATNNTRLTCKTAGKYLIVSNVSFSSNTSGWRSLIIRVNGITIIADHQITPSSGIRRLTVSTIYELAINDYVEVIAYQTSGTSIEVVSEGNRSPEFMMVKVG